MASNLLKPSQFSKNNSKCKEFNEQVVAPKV